MNYTVKKASAIAMTVILVIGGASLKQTGAQPTGRANLMPTRNSVPAKAPIKYRLSDEDSDLSKIGYYQEPEQPNAAQQSTELQTIETYGQPVISEQPVMDEVPAKDEKPAESEPTVEPPSDVENNASPAEPESTPAPEEPPAPAEQESAPAEPSEPESTPAPEEPPAPVEPVEPVKIPKPQSMIGDDGMFYVSLYKLLEDMGYTYSVSGDAADRSLVISWSDSAWGDYWVNVKTHYVHGPELLYQLSWIHLLEGEPYVPVQTIAEACFWTYSYNPDIKEATIERLALTRFKVDKTMQLMYTYGTDINGTEKLMRTSLTTTGSYFGSTPSKTYYPKPFRLNAQHKYYFPTVRVYIKYCFGLQGNICGHTPYTRSAYEINTPEMARGYAALGSRGSDGCVRFSFEDAKFIYCLGSGIPFVVVDGENTKAAQAEKERLKRRTTPYGDWIRQMKLYE